LTVEDLRIEYDTPAGTVRAVDGVSFTIDDGVNYGLSGESGCGKSTIADAILGLLPDAARVTGGRIEFDGRDLRSLSEREIRDLRWEEIAYIPQSAMDALDPVMSVGDQIIQTIRTNRHVSADSARSWARDLFETVGLDPDRTGDYPHEFSGGMRQRVVIAMALALEPDLIIADEPTTGLDVIVQDKIMAEIVEMGRRLDGSFLLITHDVGTVAETCEEFSLLYGGRVMERGSTENVLLNPTNPYTMGLKNAFLRGGDAESPIAIPGSPPDLTEEPAGCAFEPRCPFATAECREERPELASVPVRNQRSACHRLSEAGTLRREAADPATWGTDLDDDPAPGGETLLETVELTKRYRANRTLLDRLLGDSGTEVVAADGVSITVSRSEILGIAGESGCGKTTLAETIALLREPTDGRILLDGVPHDRFRDGDVMSFRRRVQIVFQDPFDALNPRMTVRQLVGEPISVHDVNVDDRGTAVCDVLDRVGIAPPDDYLNKYPHQLSGGERQRVAIARSLVLEPELLICDEPASMLDVSLKASLLRLLRDLARERSMGVIYISHDLSSLAQVADRLAILHRGEVVERGRTGAVVGDPQHPYTDALLSAMPETDPTTDRERVSLPSGDEQPPVPTDGCSFAPRCPRADDRCRERDPSLSPVAERPHAGHAVACHFPVGKDERPDGVPGSADPTRSPAAADGGDAGRTGGASERDRDRDDD
jgi:peptide/nickel transport system ATP-binding protein